MSTATPARQRHPAARAGPREPDQWRQSSNPNRDMRDMRCRGVCRSILQLVRAGAALLADPLSICRFGGAKALGFGNPGFLEQRPPSGVPVEVSLPPDARP